MKLNARPLLALKLIGALKTNDFANVLAQRGRVGADWDGKWAAPIRKAPIGLAARLS